MGKAGVSCAALFRLAGVVGSVALSSCGGGGGSSSPAPVPTPAPAPAPSLPSVTATKAVLSQLPANCSTLPGCIAHTLVSVDATGEVTAFWSELPPGGVSRLAVTNISRNAAVLSSGAVESNFAAPELKPFIARPVDARRFVVIHQYGPGSSNQPTIARVVTTGTTGPPTNASAVTLPASLHFANSLPVVVEDSTRQLYAYGNVTAPFPAVALGSGVDLKTVRPMGFTYLSIADAGVDVDFAESAAPRSLRVLRGQAMPTDDVGMYVSDMDLVSGTILPPTKVSIQPINTSNAQLTCQDVIPMRASASVGASGTSYQVAWRQLNTAGTSCDLFINGQKINTASHVVSFAVSGRNGDIVAVWMERDVAVPITERVHWSRRDPATGNWSTPAPLSTQVPLTGNQQMIAGSAGPSGTLAISWQALGTNGGNLLSKYVAGTWTTVTAPPVSDIRALAINAAGQVAAVYRSASCGSSMCEELSVYQF